LTLSVLWTLASADFERCMTVASVIFCLFGISAIAILGWPKGRNIGSIQPNLFAAPLLAGFIFSQFRAGPIGVIVRILCFGMVALVSSRFAFIGCIIAMVMHELIFNPLSPRKIPALIIAVVAGIIFWPQIIGVLALDDSTRDLSSGLAGRDELWRGALATIAENPFGIGFKRTIGNESGHNGYLKTLLEFGIVGGGLIIFLVGCILIIAGVEAVTSSAKDPRRRRFACARFGGLAAMAFGAFFQPQLLSLGDPFGISLLFLLFRPKPNAGPDRSPASETIGDNQCNFKDHSSVL
jgi:O-antigen ligase